MTGQTHQAPFANWAHLLDAIRAEYPIYFDDPRDDRRQLVSAIVRTDGRLYVVAPWTDAAAYIADHSHLSRFSRRANKRTVAA